MKIASRGTLLPAHYLPADRLVVLPRGSGRLRALLLPPDSLLGRLPPHATHHALDGYAEAWNLEPLRGDPQARFFNARLACS